MLADAALPLIGLIFALFIAWGVGYLGGSGQELGRNIPRAYQQGAEQAVQRDCAGQDRGAMVRCVRDHVQAAAQTAHDEQDLSAQKRAADSALAAAIAAFATLVVSVTGVVYVKRTLDATLRAVEDTSRATEAMLEANALAKDTAQRQLRAYVGVQAAWLEFSEEGEPIAHVKWKNFGQTPALETASWTHSWTAEFPLRSSLPEPPEGFRKGVNVISPGNFTDTVTPDGAPLSDRNRKSIEAEEAAFYVYGKSRYEDVFGERHETSFVYFCKGKGSLERGRLAGYILGNVQT